MKKIKLTQGKYALVDDGDYKELNKHKWYVLKTKENVYATRYSKRTIHMHREIMQTPKGLHTDHINHNGLDNRRKNLIICTNQQNHFNCKLQSNSTSGYKCVSFDDRKKVKKWYSYIKVNQKRFFLGYFKTKEEAAERYNKEARKVFGKYCFLNKIS